MNLQESNLRADLDVIEGKGLGTFGATNTLHRAEFGLTTNGKGADTALVFQEFGDNGAGGGAHSIVELL